MPTSTPTNSNIGSTMNTEARTVVGWAWCTDLSNQVAPNGVLGGLNLFKSGTSSNGKAFPPKWIVQVASTTTTTGGGAVS